MHIGSNIQKLRRERDITQEQLAEYLNISVSAISQWENGKTSPDLSQLPLLAYLFEVSADVILGINIDTKASQVDAIYNAADDEAIAGHYNRAIEILRCGLAEFPTSYKLMGALVEKLFIGQRSEIDEISALCHKILSKCTDNEIKASAFTIACRCNPQDENLTAVALQFAKSLPAYNSAQNEMLTFLYTGDELVAQLRENIMATVCRVSSNLHALIEETCDDDEVLLICEKSIRLYEIMYEDSDYGITSF